MRRRRMGVWFRLVVALAKPLLVLFTRRDWRGREHLPRSGGVLVAANHISHADPLLLGHFVYESRRLPRYLAKVELFGVPVLGRVLAGAGQIPVHRRTADAALALKDAVAALEAGECVMIYPEGTLTRDPDLWPMSARTGVARLALATGVPVVPVAHWGAHQILPPYARRLRLIPPRRSQVLAGPPVDLSPWEGRAQTAEVLREVTEAVMSAVRRQLGELRGETPPEQVWDARRDPRRDARRDARRNRAHQ